MVDLLQHLQIYVCRVCATIKGHCNFCEIVSLFVVFVVHCTRWGKGWEFVCSHVTEVRIHSRRLSLGSWLSSFLCIS